VHTALCDNDPLAWGIAVWHWLASRKSDLPSYALLEDEPSRGLPSDLAAQENSAAHRELSDRIESDLRAHAADENSPGFATFLKEGNGLLQFRAPQLAGGCLLAFSSPFRAADYARVQVPGKKFAFFCSSPAQVVTGIAQMRAEAGITHLALDRCPRCNVFTTVGVSSFDTADEVIAIWTIAKATEIARCNLYLDYALAAAAAGQLLVARNVALELVGHVTAEDPRAHLLLVKLALQLRDKRLQRDARRFLTFLKQDAALAQLDAAIKTRRVQY